jgi:hypothetical protein
MTAILRLVCVCQQPVIYLRYGNRYPLCRFAYSNPHVELSSLYKTIYNKPTFHENSICKATPYFEEDILKQMYT